MKQVSYWEAQENRWHEKYLEAEQLIDKVETKVWEQACRIADLEVALRQICELNNKRDRFSSEIDLIIIAALGENNV